MSQERIADAQLTHLPSPGKVWLAALMHPSMSNYQGLGQQSSISAWRAYMWVFAGGLIGGAIDSLRPFIVQLAERSAIDLLLVALIPVSSLIAVCYLAAFAWCTQRIAHVFKGSGTYRQLAAVFASFSAPLLIAAGILDMVPMTRAVLIALYIYWLALYVLAVRAVNAISRTMAIAAVLAALLILGFAWLAIAFLIGYSGLLLP